MTPREISPVIFQVRHRIAIHGKSARIIVLGIEDNMKVKAILSRKKDDFSLQDIELSKPKSNQLLIKIVASGVCHTDATVLNGTLPVAYPVVIGHEGAGIVVEVGENVVSVKPGDHVVLGFSYCGHCKHCLTGNASACTDFEKLNFSGKDEDNCTPLTTTSGEEISQIFGQSSLSTYCVVNEKNVCKVDSQVDLRYLGPLGCGIMTGSGTVFNALQPKIGSSIVVFGTGAVGLSAIMAAKVSGCLNIIAVDVHNNRLALAQELGATHVINSREQNPVDAINVITRGGAEYAIDTTGIPAVCKQALDCLDVYGVMVVLAVSNADITLNLNRDLVAKGKTIKGVLEGDASPKVLIPILVELYKKGQFPVDKLMRFYQPEEINKAFADSASGEVIKPVIVFDNSLYPAD